MGAGTNRLDNVFVERLWRSVKQEEVYLHDYQTVSEAKNGLTAYFRWYNQDWGMGGLLNPVRNVRRPKNP